MSLPPFPESIVCQAIPPDRLAVVKDAKIFVRIKNLLIYEKSVAWFVVPRLIVSWNKYLSRRSLCTARRELARERENFLFNALTVSWWCVHEIHHFYRHPHSAALNVKVNRSTAGSETKRPTKIRTASVRKGSIYKTSNRQARIKLFIPGKPKLIKSVLVFYKTV